MSKQPDTLVSYVAHAQCKARTGRDKIETARMASIDSKGMKISYIVQGIREEKEIHIPFEPPLSSEEDIRPRLIQLKKAAEEELNISPVPTVQTFRLPAAVIPICFMILQLYMTTIAPDDSWYGWLRDAVGGWRTIKFLWIFTVTAHIGEALYAALLCRRFNTSFGIGAAWTFGVLCVGAPVWIELKRLARLSRIEAINKAK